MKYSTVLATAGLAAIAHAQEQPDESFQPGIEVTPLCIEDPWRNHCPGQLKSGNALLTSWSYVVRSDNEKQPGDTTLFRIQFAPGPDGELDGELVEDRTLSLFDMPAGYEDKQCRLKFIYNYGNAYVVDADYSVWALEGDGSDVTTDTTWDTKPEATEKLATFITREIKGDINMSPEGEFMKMDGEFLENPTFPCPGPGKFAFETRGNDPEKLNLKVSGIPLNLGGGDGLAIEIIGVPSGYSDDNDDDDDDDGHDDDDDTEPPTTTTTQVPGVPHPTDFIPVPPTGSFVPVPRPGDDDHDGENGLPGFEGGASRATAFFSGAVLLAAVLPLVF